MTFRSPGWRATLVAALLCTASGAAHAQTTCRPNALGRETCLRANEPPPLPRPPGLVEKRGYAEKLPRSDPADTGPQLIPGRKRNRLGSTLPGEPVRGIGGTCRSDRLGNLVCP